jgi:excisionase family DNA binding protein
VPGQLLTTGQAARHCSVKPDTVLKWIKKGRLRATRTIGGHYRVDERDLAPLLGESDLEEQKGKSAPCSQQPLRCWEFLSDGLRSECKNCIAYRVHAVWCFHLIKLTHAAGHGKRFCTGSCLDCPYYRRTHAQPTNVLILTRDEALIQYIAKKNNESIACRYARTGYDASAIISVFRPALVIVDERILQDGESGLVDALASDPRTRGARILLGVRDGNPVPSCASEAIAGTIREPFCSQDILTWAERSPVEVLPEDQRSGHN